MVAWCPKRPVIPSVPLEYGVCGNITEKQYPFGMPDRTLGKLEIDPDAFHQALPGDDLPEPVTFRVKGSNLTWYIPPDTSG
jgi:hypothetical protein